MSGLDANALSQMELTAVVFHYCCRSRGPLTVNYLESIHSPNHSIRIIYPRDEWDWFFSLIWSERAST